MMEVTTPGEELLAWEVHWDVATPAGPVVVPVKPESVVAVKVPSLDACIGIGVWKVTATYYAR